MRCLNEFALFAIRSARNDLRIRKLARRLARALCLRSFLSWVYFGPIGTRYCANGDKTRFRYMACNTGCRFNRCNIHNLHSSGPVLALVRCFSTGDRVDRRSFAGNECRHATACVGASNSPTDVARNITYTFRDSITAPGTEVAAKALEAILQPVARQLPPQAPSFLIREFGSISGVASASETQLRKLLGETNPLVDTLLVCRHLIEAAMIERVERAILDPTDPKFRQYIAHQLGFERRERLVAIFGNEQGEFITMETIALGVLDEVCVTSRSLFGRAMSLDARCFLLAHNHPSGCADPSNGDVQATREINKLAEALGIDLLDHLIVAKGQVVSMRERGLL